MSEHPTAAALAGYAEGGEPQLAEHVDACPACREQTAAFQAVSNLLAAASPATRSSCPPRDALTLAEEALDAPLRRHLAACPWCAADRRDWLALAAPAPLEALRGAVTWLLDAAARSLEVAATTLPPAPAPALAAARGGPEGGAPAGVQAVFGDGSLTVVAAARRGAVDLRLAASERAPRPFRVELRGEGDLPLESRTSGRDGATTLTDLSPGPYRLLVFAAGATAADVELTIDLTSSFDKPPVGRYTEGDGSDGG